MTQQVEDSSKPECETPEVVAAAPPPAPAPVTETTEDKAIVPVTPAPEENPEESKALAVVESNILIPPLCFYHHFVPTSAHYTCFTFL